MTQRLTLCLILLASTMTQGAGGQGNEADAAYKATLLAQKRGLIQGLVANPSSLVHCAVGNDTQVHSLGFAAKDTMLTIDFESDSDPIAMLAGIQLGSDAISTAPGDIDDSNVMTWTDDDSGGQLEPRLSVLAPFNGTYLLFVSPFFASTTTGGVEEINSVCYLYELQVVAPPGG